MEFPSACHRPASPEKVRPSNITFETSARKDQTAWEERVNTSSRRPYLKLTLALFLIPTPVLGILFLCGIRSLLILATAYGVLLALEGWFVWMCMRAIFRHLMASEADAVEEDRHQLQYLASLEESKPPST